MYAVVFLPDLMSFDVVPTNWIADSKVYRFPIKGLLLKNAVKNRVPPWMQWERLPAEIVKRTGTEGDHLSDEPVLDTLDEADKVLAEINATSDGICKPPTDKPKRARRRHSDANIDVNYDGPSSSSVPPVTTTTVSSTPQGDIPAVCDGLLAVLDAFSRFENQCQSMTDRLRELEEANAALSATVEGIRQTVQNNGNNPAPSKPVCMKTWFPLKTKADWEKMERLLKSQDCQRLVVGYISSFKSDDPNPDKTIRSILRHLIGFKLAVLINWNGYHNKIPFRDSRLFAAMEDALWKFDDDETFHPTLLAKSCVAWLQGSRDRGGAALWGKKKKQQTKPKEPTIKMDNP
ncbi:unnamed protein product [Calicophoron daubneyi]|uniref:DUF4806 domain-containing protein n=1 Tax=Calicophoron daubneyi TaxID=300641 RepID=A0AAV2U2H9_CALDB